MWSWWEYRHSHQLLTCCRYALPMSSFRCNATVIPNKITFQFLSETPGDSVSFCLDDVVIE